MSSTENTATARFSLVGVTGDVTACDCCGRDDLKKTVILGALDADGNVEDVVYYGSECAARALGRRGAARKVYREAEDTARAADAARRREASRQRAQDTLDAIEAGTFTDADLRFGWVREGMAAYVEMLRFTVRHPGA